MHEHGHNVLGPVLGHLLNLHPEFKPGFGAVTSWLLLGDRKKFEPEPVLTRKGL